MASSMIDSVLFYPMFTTPELKACFSDEATIQGWMNIWKALATTQAEHGVISKETATEIVRQGDVKNIDLCSLAEGIIKCGHPLMPALNAYEHICEKGAGQYIHMGATTQDLADTGWMLMMKQGFRIIYNDMREVELAALKLTEKYKNTVMAGRTHGQQALPLTFGYKTAIWVSELRRCIERMKECWNRDFVGQLSGAVGTMAGFGENGDIISDETIRKIGLDVPEIAWHTSRDRIASILSTITLASLACGHIGRECCTLMKTEYGEVQEGFTRGAIGSSTMPHKRNPVLSEIVQVLGRLAKTSCDVTMNSMYCEHERDASVWRIEWRGIGECFISAGAGVFKAKRLLQGLQVNEKKMRENLELTKGLMYSEPVMFLLGKHIGKLNAHELVYDISMDAFEQDAYFIDKLMENETVKKYVTREELAALMEPEGYTGMSADYAQRVIKNTYAARELDELRELGKK